MSTALVQTQAATSLEVTVGMRGPVLVRATAPDPVSPVGGRVLFTIGDMTLVTTLVPNRSGMFAGSWAGMAVTGANGWGSPVSAKGYRSKLGLLNTQIVNDAALAVGEQVVVQSPKVLGGFYTRRADLLASQVLSPRVIGAADWWVDGQGITQIGTRLPGLVTAEFALMGFDRAAGKLDIASESPAAFMPGKTVVTSEGEFTINCARWTANGGQLRGELWIA